MVTQALVASLLGYWASDHQMFNTQLLKEGRPFAFKRADANIDTVDLYLKRVLYVQDGLKAEVTGVGFSDDPRGSDRPSDSPNITRSLLQWNELGGLWEDGFSTMGDAQFYGGLRAPNHFHDPLAFEGGYTGIKTETGFSARWVKEKTGKPVVDLFRAGVSATRWARGGNSNERNEWGYPTVSAGFTEFFTKLVPDDRQRGLAAAFRSLGQLEHLVTDNTVPDHARDLAHPGQGFEEWLNKRPDYFRATSLPWPKFPLGGSSSPACVPSGIKTCTAASPRLTAAPRERGSPSSPRRTSSLGTASRHPTCTSPCSSSTPAHGWPRPTLPISPPFRPPPVSASERCPTLE